MKKITYREICQADYILIKKLIDEVWNLNQFCDTEQGLEDSLNIYLQSSLLDISYGKAAILDGKVVGILLGKDDSQKILFNRFAVLWRLVKSSVSLLFHSTRQMRQQLKNALKISKAEQEMMGAQKKIFTGHIELLIVGKEARGLGIGKALVDDFISYTIHGNENALYVQTDTLCNYGFYEHQGFEQLDSIEIAINDDDQITLFLYQYKQGENLQ
ncbi:GNAT family N-acetyltransferase [Blautia producta]|uniref:GNAT family N-acetyltransferase n=1 Tax=Blautia producta TaxID=33035 RepID=UPI0031B61630